MIELPKCLARLIDLAGDQSRFSMSGVQLLANGSGFTFVATDGKALGIASGPVEPPGAEVAALIPADAWQRAFKTLLTSKRCSIDKLYLETDANNVVRFRSLNGSIETQQLDGRFPDWRQVLAGKEFKLPMVRVTFDPDLLARVLKVAGSLCPDGTHRVELLFYGAGKPLGIIARGENGLFFDAVIMPLT